MASSAENFRITLSGLNYVVFLNSVLEVPDDLRIYFSVSSHIAFASLKIPSQNVYKLWDLEEASRIENSYSKDITQMFNFTSVNRQCCCNQISFYSVYSSDFKIILYGLLTQQSLIVDFNRINIHFIFVF